MRHVCLMPPQGLIEKLDPVGLIMMIYDSLQEIRVYDATTNNIGPFHIVCQ